MRSFWAALAATSLSSIIASSPAQGQAQAQVQAQIDLDIPSQELSKSLRDVARATNTNILFDPEQTRGKQAPPLKGRYTAKEAIDRLIAHQSLAARNTGTGTWVVSAEGKAESVEPGVRRQYDPGGLEGQSAGNADTREIVVTGSRVAPPIAPTIVATRRDIEQSGRTSLPDFIATIPQVYLSNNGASAISLLGGFGDSSFSSSISLRGLGADSTLTLLNGRRMAPAAGVLRGSITDISGIPVAAIERVEIVPDGSSAIYGSDAMGGVVNIILRKKYDGLEIGGSYGFSTRGEPVNKRGSIVAGKSWKSGSLLAGYEYLEFGNLVASDRSYTATRDLRPRGGTDFRNTFAAPGNVTALDGNLNAVQQALGLATPVPFGALPAGDGRNLSPGAVRPGVRNVTDVLPDSSIFPGDKRSSAWANFEQDISPAVRFFATGLYSRRNIQFTAGPPTATLTVPASNAFNRFGEAVSVSYLFQEELGAQVIGRRQKAYVINAGLDGEFGKYWSWEISAGYAKSRFDGSQSFGFDVPARTAALADSNPATALNVFGDGTGQNMDTFRKILTTTELDGKASVQTYLATLTGRIPQLSLFGGEPPRLALGAEYRVEGQTLRSVSTASNAAPATLTGANGRKVHAGFAELLLPFFGSQNRRPILYDLELSLAGRFEHYNDFGDSFSPRVGIRWRPHRAITLRAAASHSFKAPSLEQLFQPFSQSPSTVSDPKRGGASTAVTFTNSGNPALDAETSTSRSLGILFEPRLAKGNLSAELNYFHLKAKNRVTSISTLSQLFLFEDVLPPGIIIRNSSGVLTEIVFKPFNSARETSEGFDASLRAGINSGWGHFALDANATYYIKLQRQLVATGPVLDNSRNTGFPPKWRARAGLSWSKGIASLSSAVNLVPGSINTLFALPGGKLQKVDSFTTVDASGSLHFDREGQPLRGLRLTVAVLNLFDKDPPFVNGFLPYDPSRADPRGRFINISLTKAFGPDSHDSR